MSEACYVCYDVKGIQSFIFRVPKLKYVIGGSALIDRFDRKTMPELKVAGAERISSAGGKGSFRCESESVADQVEKAVIAAAHAVGLDVRIGRASTFVKAAKTADRTYSCQPESYQGQPCRASGLYPVQSTRDGVHPIVDKRCEPQLRRYFEQQMAGRIAGSLALADADSFEFFHNVDAEDPEGRIGAKALGGRNRWAVICMDGNDMGTQYREQARRTDGGDIDFSWLKKMSAALDECTRGAATEGVIEVLQEWQRDNKGQCGETLPIRPVVIGGDDVIVLCHVSYAFTFVKRVCEAFNLRSKTYKDLWVGTGGELTISAGILFCPVSLPLHTAIPYAESLLASAKTRGRKAKQSEREASPAALDWEQVTDGLIDTPAARRQRELRFYDKGCGYGLDLTCRPYLLKDFNQLEVLASRYEEIPPSSRAEVLPALTAPYNDRLAYYARIKKNHPGLYDDLQEFEPEHALGGKWKRMTETGSGYYQTSVVDALLLLEERKRMSYETV